MTATLSRSLMNSNPKLKSIRSLQSPSLLPRAFLAISKPIRSICNYLWRSVQLWYSHIHPSPNHSNSVTHLSTKLLLASTLPTNAIYTSIFCLRLPWYPKQPSRSNKYRDLQVPSPLQASVSVLLHSTTLSYAPCSTSSLPVIPSDFNQLLLHKVARSLLYIKARHQYRKSNKQHTKNTHIYYPFTSHDLILLAIQSDPSAASTCRSPCLSLSNTETWIPNTLIDLSILYNHSNRHLSHSFVSNCPKCTNSTT